jgi:hypothetical protein
MSRKKRITWRGASEPSLVERMWLFREMVGLYLLEVEQAEARARRIRDKRNREAIASALKSAKIAGMAAEDWRKCPGEQEAEDAARFLALVPGLMLMTIGWRISSGPWADRLEMIARDSQDVLEDLVRLSPYAAAVVEHRSEA